jgi:hypothetical protein
MFWLPGCISLPAVPPPCASVSLPGLVFGILAKNTKIQGYQKKKKNQKTVDRSV